MYNWKAKYLVNLSNNKNAKTLEKVKPPGKLMEKFVKKFGISMKDAPKAIVIHELLGIMMLAITWSFCYRFPPSQIPFLKAPIAKIIDVVRIPPKVTSFVSNIKLPFMQVGDANSKKVVSAYIESSCMRKLVRPVTLPGKIWLTCHLLRKLTSDHEQPMIF